MVYNGFGYKDFTSTWASTNPACPDGSILNISGSSVNWEGNVTYTANQVIGLKYSANLALNTVTGYNGASSTAYSSGVFTAEIDGFYLFEGYSGSVYACNEKRYGSTAYGYGVLHNIIEKSKEAGVKVEIMPEDTNLLDLPYE
jgi:hypothetical protein